MLQEAPLKSAFAGGILMVMAHNQCHWKLKINFGHFNLQFVINHIIIIMVFIKTRQEDKVPYI